MRDTPREAAKVSTFPQTHFGSTEVHIRVRACNILLDIATDIPSVHVYLGKTARYIVLTVILVNSDSFTYLQNLHAGLHAKNVVATLYCSRKWGRLLSHALRTARRWACDVYTHSESKNWNLSAEHSPNRRSTTPLLRLCPSSAPPTAPNPPPLPSCRLAAASPMAHLAAPTADPRAPRQVGELLPPITSRMSVTDRRTGSRI